MNDSRDTRGKIVVFSFITAAAAVRAVFLVQLSGSPLGGLLPLDMRFYYDLAVSVTSGAGLPHGGLTFNPMYPVFLAAVFRVFGEGLLVPRIIQCLAGLLTVWLIYLSAGLLVPGPEGKARPRTVAGTAAAALAILYPQPLLYEGSLLATSLVTLVMAASFLTALKMSRALRGKGDVVIAGRSVPLPAAAALLGLLTGVGITGRPNIFLVLAPMLTVWLIALSGRRGNKWKLPAAYAAAVIVTLLPLSLYNSSRTGSILPVTTHGGINLFIGNMDGARGLYDPPPGMRRDMRGLIEDSRRAAEKAEGRRLTDAEVSAYWSARARERIASDPGGWLALLGRKVLLFWNGGELGDIVDSELMKEEAPVFRLLVVRFALISALAFTGILLVIRYGEGKWPLIVFTAASMAAIVLFYFNTRYRLPSLPVLAASAGYFISWTADRIVTRRWKEAGAALLVCAVFFAAVSGRKMFEVNRSATYAFLGNNYMSEGNGEKALDAFREAFRIDPESVENRINLARGLSRAGDKAGAAGYYQLAWEKDPDFPNLALEYGYLLEEQGKRGDAAGLYIHAWNSGRRNEMITAAKLLSRMAYTEGDRETAINWIGKALEIAPGDKELLRLLNMLEGPQ